MFYLDMPIDYGTLEVLSLILQQVFFVPDQFFFVTDNLVLKRGTGVIRVILLVIDSHMQRNNN